MTLTLLIFIRGAGNYPMKREVHVLRAADHGPALAIVEGEGLAKPIVWPGVGANLRSMQRIELAAHSRTITLQHQVEAVYFVMRGGGSVRDPNQAGGDELVEGSMVHVEPTTVYLFEAGSNGIVLLGGPCPADPGLYRTAE